MARSTVEILGGQLDGTVLNNAASESTLKEIVAAINGMSGGGSGGGGSGGSGGGGSASRKRKQEVGVLNKLSNELGNQLGNAIGAAASLGTMLATGNTRMSAYTKVLNDQVISQLPLVGGLLGSVGGVVNSSIEALEDWNEALRKGTSSGASFGNSILNAAQAAASAGMGLDDFMDLVSSNSTKLLSLGGTVSDGATRFSKISKQLVREGGAAANSLRQMGYSVKDLNQGLVGYLENVGMGVADNDANNRLLAESYESYRMTVDKISKLTGKSAKQIEDQMSIASNDVAFKMKLSKMGVKEREALLATLAEYSARFGETGADLFKSVVLNVTSQNEATQDLMIAMPSLVKDMKRAASIAKINATDSAEWQRQSDDLIIKSMMSGIKAGKDWESVLRAASTGNKELSGLYTALTPILSLLVKNGDINKLTEEQLRAALKEAREEQKKREKITQLLNDFDIAIGEARSSLIEAVIPILREIAEIAEREKLADHLREFGVYLSQVVKDYMPDVIAFFKYMGSAEGREYLWNEITNWFETMGVEFDAAIKTFFKPDKAADYARKKEEELERLAKEHSNKQQKLKIPSSPTAQAAEKEAEKAGPPKSTQAAQRLLDLIAKGEGATPANLKRQRSGQTPYDMIYGFGQYGEPPQPLSQMTIGQVMAFQQQLIRATQGKVPGTNKGTSAVGKYQFISTTLASAMKATGLSPADKFNAENQEKMGMHLLQTAGGMTDFAKTGNKANFQDRLAHVWASVRNQHGKGVYAGQTGSTTMDSTSSLMDEIKAGHATGTLGTYGTLFRDFGRSTETQLHGDQAVMTPSQMSSVMNTAGSVDLAQLMSTTESKLAKLISLSSQRLMINNSQLESTEKMANSLT